MSTILVSVIVSVFGGLLLAAILFLTKSVFGSQPKLRVRILPGLYMSTVGNGRDSLKCIWKNSLEIYNSTAFNAFSVTLSWPKVVQQLPISNLEPPHIDAMQTRTLDFQIEREFPKKAVIACHDRFKELLPSELRSVVLILRYQNDKGISFYTRYERSGDTEKSTFHRFRPEASG
jgi:hypothetical protein